MERLDILKQANKCFLDSNYGEALALYESLAQDKQLSKLYDYNIFICRRELGIAVSSGQNEVDDPEVVSSNLFSSDAKMDVVFLHAKAFVMEPAKQIEKLLFYVYPLGALLNSITIFSDMVSKKDIIVDQIDERLKNLFNRVTFKAIGEFNKYYVDTLASGRVRAYMYHEESIPNASPFDKKTLQQLAQKANNIWRIHDDIQHHGSFYLKSLADIADSAKYKRRLKDNLIKLKELNSERQCYVYGTGPSLKYSYLNPEAQENIVITCNSIVKNPTLMSFLKPDIICATDPIFHAGWGNYAEEFRKNLLKSLGEHDFILVVPHRDLHIYLAYLPVEFHERICSYDFDPEIGILNCNLIERQASAPKPNVLTNIMLPIAATISENIYIGGCDGKKNPSSYFWEHDKSSQLNNQMEDIKKEFKGFFDISYDKYYEEHCQTLALQIVELENKGYTVNTVTPSYIPALEQRLSLPNSIKILSSHAADVTVIMPSHNMANSIVASVKSVLVAAEYGKLDLSLIIIDETSQDETQSLLKDEFSYEITTGKVHIVSTSGLGVSSARNIGLALSNSDYITFLDADDFISEDSLQVRIGALKGSDSTVIGSFSKTKLVNYTTDETISVANNFEKSGLEYTFERVHAPAHISSILYKKEMIDGVVFPNNMQYGEDWLFLSRVLRNGGKLLFCSDSHSVYSIHENSVTKRSPANHILGLYDAIAKIYFNDDGVTIQNAKFEAGLSNVKANIPSFTRKFTELTMRLMACLFVEYKPNKFYQELQQLDKKGLIPITELDSYLLCHTAEMSESFKRDVKRFSAKSDINFEDLKRFINRSRVKRKLPSIDKVFSALWG